MAFFNNRDQYGWMSLFLHWLLFVLLAGMLAGGKYSASLAPDDKIGLIIDLHKQVGMAVFVLMAFRLLWRLINRSLDSTGNILMRFTAFLVHWLMYIVVLVQAAIGVTMSQMAGHDVLFFNTFEVPSLVEFGKGFLTQMSFFVELITNAQKTGAQMYALHAFFGNALLALIGLHIAGALFHHIFMGDDILRRIFFGYKPSYAEKSAAESKIRR
ncbi:MAG: cytochrome b [Gammaproteobacteria bacterium]